MDGLKKFIRQFLWFLLIPSGVLAGIEFYLYQYPSTFNLKARYLHRHLDDTTVLILGSSHNQMAVNPAWMPSVHVSNLAFGGQDLQLDSCLLFRYLPKMHNLKVCVFELSYHSLEHANESAYDRNALYLRYHNINNFGRAVRPLDYSIFLSSPKRYIRFLNPFQRPTAVNEFGFATELSRFEQGLNRFESLGYDTAKINATPDNVLISRHRYEDLAAFANNRRITESMIRYCTDHRVRPVILIPPVYDTYSGAMIPAKKDRRDRLLQELAARYPTLVILNQEHNNSYQVTDFKNDDHLSPAGARKFSAWLEARLRNLPD